MRWRTDGTGSLAFRLDSAFPGARRSSVFTTGSACSVVCTAVALDLLPLLSTLARGPAAASEAGALFLRGRSRTIWHAALRAAPPHAIELALQSIRLADESDPADSVVWGPAAHLAASSRGWVRLIGLTSGGWPRRGTEDAILPDHIIPAEHLDPAPVAEVDRRCFWVIAGSAREKLVLSRSRRNAQGSRLGKSPLVPAEWKPRVLTRARIPQHAFSETDRLMARPSEAAELDASSRPTNAGAIGTSRCAYRPRRAVRCKASVHHPGPCSHAVADVAAIAASRATWFCLEIRAGLVGAD